jgi:glycosyltransferase involved in cell wall biosynthesis
MDRLSSSESVAIVVVPRDRFSIFPQCLEALYAYTHVRFRVIVVAGGTDRVTEKYLHQLQVQKGNMSVVLLDRLLMQGEARNVALRQANERFCVVLENDTIVHENWLAPMLECMREERAAAVMPLILWYRGIHAAGCMFEEREKDGVVVFHHKIMYTGIRRRRIDYPENHCVLIDRNLLPSIDIFDDVEPFDVDLGLTLRKYGLSVFLEPLSVVTYAAPPPLEIRDIPPFKLRWDAASWEARNRRFMQKWGVTYDPSSKRASYRRQQLKLGLARWYPNKFTVGVSNVAFSSVNRLLSLVMQNRASVVGMTERKLGCVPASTGYTKTNATAPVSFLSPLPIEARPRILFVDNQVGDFLQYRIVLARKLREIGFDVHVAVPREPGLEDISRQAIPVHVFYLRRKSTRPLDELLCLVSLLRLYQRLRPTLVHHVCLKPALYGGIAARIAGVPAAVDTLTGLGYLFTTHTVKTRLLRSMVARGFRFSFRHQNHRVILQNSDDRDCLLARSNMPGDHAVLIKGSGVNLSLFTPEPEPDGPPVVLMASRLLWTKGVGEFVTAARVLRARRIRARFVLLGEPDPGHPSAVPVRTLEHWRDAGDVEWPGWQHDMPALIAQSHIVCLPSYYGEGVPRILLEASASGRPIVATDTPGCREVVRHGQNGLLVPAGDGEALIGAIAQLIENAPLRAAMGTRGREIAGIEFSVEQVIDANLAVYRSLFASIPGAWKSLVTTVAR